jgi:hypothetical protein
MRNGTTEYPEYFKTAIILLDSPDILWYGGTVCDIAKIPFILTGFLYFLEKSRFRGRGTLLKIKQRREVFILKKRR